MRDAISRGSASILLAITLVSLITSALAQGASMPLPRRPAPACRACRSPRRRSACPPAARSCRRRSRWRHPSRQRERRLLQGHRHRQAAEPELAEPGVRGQPAGSVEPPRAADGRRRLQRHAGDRPRPASRCSRRTWTTRSSRASSRSAPTAATSPPPDSTAASRWMTRRCANFGKESVKKGHDVAIEIIKKAYGRAPERSYFIGGSQGGHEALDAAARYPNDYDGVVAHYPAYNVTLLHLGSLNVGRALYEGGGAAWINPAKVKLITDAVYAKCDRPRRREGRHHQRHQGVQRRVRREDAALRQRRRYAATRVCPMSSWQRWRRSPATTSPGSPSLAWTRSRAGRCSKARCSRGDRASARCRSRRIRSQARSRCSIPLATRPPSSSSAATPSSTR